MKTVKNYNMAAAVN